MRAVILAGGFGTRLTEETEIKPKALVEVGDHPILWHVLKHFDHFGIKEFFIALGYKGDAIKQYFLDYYTLGGSMSLDLVSGQVQRHDMERDDWKVHLIETGLHTYTGGRLKRLRAYLREETFIITYCDGVANIDIDALVGFHRKMGKIATVTAVRPPSRFGGILFDGDDVEGFTEKPQIGEGWINGGFIVCEPSIFDHIAGDDSSLEAHVLEALADMGQLAAYRHEDFWQCMDTMRDRKLLQSLWDEGAPPWKVWP